MNYYLILEQFQIISHSFRNIDAQKNKLYKIEKLYVQILFYLKIMRICFRVFQVYNYSQGHKNG